MSFSPSIPLVTRRTQPLPTGRRLALDMPAFLTDVSQRYGNAVLLHIEVMTIFRAGYETIASAHNDCPLGGHPVPHGATVAVSQWVMLRAARYFSAPEQFRPERWLEGVLTFATLTQPMLTLRPRHGLKMQTERRHV